MRAEHWLEVVSLV